MTLLGGDVAALFGELFAGEYHAATLRQTTDTYDDEGTLSRDASETECRVQIDRATERMVAAEGYTAGDCALFVLAKPPGPLSPIDALDTGAEVTVETGPYAGVTFKLGAPIERDPACAYWTARGTQTRAST